MKLLDTTFLVDHQRGEGSVARFLEDCEEKGETLITSSINLKEIAVGRFLVEEPKPSIEDVLADFGWLEVEPFSEKGALEAARIESELRQSDDYEPELAADVLIAGVACSLGAPVVTRNTEDFDTFEVVSIEEY
jgi:predicted nucleic acid-binding protein